MSGFIHWIGTLRVHQDHNTPIEINSRFPAETAHTVCRSGGQQTDSASQLADPRFEVPTERTREAEDASHNKKICLEKPASPEDVAGGVENHSLNATQHNNAFPASSLARQWRLDIGRSCRNMAQILGLNRLQHYLQGTSTELLPHAPVWILGVEHSPAASANGNQTPVEVHKDAMEDFTSRLWMTYRSGFDPIGETTLTSDVGWGCTLRSGQMLIAEGLLRHTLGRSWRRQSDTATIGSGTPPEIMQLLQLMHDTGAKSAPLSVHNLCAARGVPGVQPGEWLGPWVLCAALRSAVMASRPFGIALHVLAEPGGGAPVLYESTLLETYFASSRTGHVEQQAPTEEHNAPTSSSDNNNNTEIGLAHCSEEAPTDETDVSALILLLPLTLGIGKVNPRYIPQLQSVLKWPQSIGIIGGRPGSSLAFVGCQEDSIVFLDPHETQQVVPFSEVGHSATYHCDTIRTMPIANIDPSLAIGFYCRTPEALKELCSQLRDLEVKSGGAPLVGIVDGPAPPSSSWRHVSSFDGSDEDSGGAGGNDNASAWEML